MRTGPLPASLFFAMSDHTTDAQHPLTLSPETEPHAGDPSPTPGAGVPGAADGAPPAGDGAPKKKRRRRGGRGRKRKNGNPGEAVGPGAPGSPGAAIGAEADGDDDDSSGDEADGPSGSAEAVGVAPGEPARQEQRPPQPRNEHRGERGGGRGDRGPRRDDRRGGHHGQPHNRPGQQAGHSAARDGDDLDEPAPRPRPERTTPQIAPKEWEEIFEGKTFESLGLRNSVLKGCEAAGFKNPTKIQAEMIPLVLAGRDVLGQSRTGTGKTAAFGLPLFNNADRDKPFQSLILAPTRELAIQIADELAELGKFTPIRVSAVYGGQAVHAQAKKLDKGPEIIVATPGRLMDMVERGHLHLNNVKFAILDEVDRMLDIGFREDIRKILGGIKHPHQTVLVSATISEEIERLARSYMNNPEKLVTTGGSLTVSLVQQHYISVEPWDKRRMLLHCLTHEEPDLTLVFCRMKRTVDDVVAFLCKNGIDAHGMHGDLQQGKRNSVMKRLRHGELGVLVASDLAARGLDVEGISHVINYDLPEDPEIYIHRIGRTARAGRGGVAWSLVTKEQGPLLTAIEKLANTHVPEKTYPDFKPGPLPHDVEARRKAESMRVQNLKSQSRFQGPSLPAPAAAAAAAAPAPATGSSGPGRAPAQAPVPAPAMDPSKFPGGVVPTKLPPRMMMGRVRTSRSSRAPGPVPGTTAPVANAVPAPTPAPEETPATDAPASA